jgi:multisubunit Na+/H+ antiporter MnhB subunit
VDNNNEQFSAEFEKFMEAYLKNVYLKKGSRIRQFPITVFNAMSALIIGALGLIAALAWDEYLNQLFKHFFPDSDGLGSGLVYALFISIVAVLVTIFLGKSSEKKKHDIEK